MGVFKKLFIQFDENKHWIKEAPIKYRMLVTRINQHLNAIWTPLKTDARDETLPEYLMHAEREGEESKLKADRGKGNKGAARRMFGVKEGRKERESYR
jgi:hypothetical protein